MWRHDPLQDPIEAIKDELRMIAFNEADPYMDGFTTSKYKKQLLDILWYLEDLLEECDTYETEDEWLEEKEKERMLRKLSGKNKYGQN